MIEHYFTNMFEPLTFFLGMMFGAVLVVFLLVLGSYANNAFYPDENGDVNRKP